MAENKILSFQRACSSDDEAIEKATNVRHRHVETTLRRCPFAMTV
jgi:hypothetical protein